MDAYPSGYTAARTAFRAAAERAGAAALYRVCVDGVSSAGDPLSTDIAWCGSPGASRLVLHMCGLHGVEGFAGSAIQLALLADLPPLTADTALVLVHAVNPYGMDRLRRVNEHNVDLNRNCLPDESAYRGAPDGYGRLDPLLNPPTPPARDGFYLRAVANVLRHGYPALRQAVAAGQYDYPAGLFYGGSRLEDGPRRFRQWLQEHLSGVRWLLALDVHTGLGPWGRETLFAETPVARDPGFARTLGPPVVNGDPAAAGAYGVRGALASALPVWLPGTRVGAFTQEFGTYGPLRVLHALREENRWHHYGAGDADHPAKVRLRTVFCPSHARWRRRVVALGVERVRRALTVLAAV